MLIAMAMKSEAELVGNDVSSDDVESRGRDDVESDVTDDGSCLGVRRRCLQSGGCSAVLSSHRRYCRETDRPLHCSDQQWQMCMKAVKELNTLMPDLLTCSCEGVVMSRDVRQRCQRVQARFQAANNLACHDLPGGNSAAQTEVELTTRRTVADWSSSTDTDRHVISSTKFTDCRQLAANRIPAFMNIPAVIRVYDNSSGCSELCQCHLNQSVVCHTLPCAPSVACKHHNIVYLDGASFSLPERGPCRCIKAEMVCAKSRFRQEPKAGLFLHVGYSLTERHLIQMHSPLRFNVDSVRTKLSAMLNADAAQQLCRLVYHRHYDGNVIFEVASSRSKQSIAQDYQDCVTPAKSLSYLVNSRHVTLITDAELSLLKVAQLERIHFHHHHQHHHHQQQQQQRHRTSSVSVQHRSRDRSIASVPQPTPFTAFYLIIVFLSLNIS